MATGRIPVTSVAPVKFTSDEVSLPVASACNRPIPYPEKITLLFCPFLPESRISPVVDPPRVSVLPFWVWILPFPSKESALLLVVPAILAVGVPPATLRNPNFAALVACEPRSKSWVVILSVIAPLNCSNGLPPLVIGNIPVTSDEARLIAVEERTPLVE